MKFEPIVTSLLDTDLYKLTMGQVFNLKHNGLVATYEFKCRNEGVKFTQEMLDEINLQIDHLCELTYTEEELLYLSKINFLYEPLISRLTNFRLQRKYINAILNEDGTLTITAKGPIFDSSPFEIYVLEIVNEVFFRMSYDYDMLQASAKEKLEKKIEDFRSGKYNFKFSEFGTRRRLSREWQEEVVKRFVALPNSPMVGTSNLYLAMKYHLIPVGTYAHEYVELYQGINGRDPAFCNKYAMDNWYEVYNGNNGTALTDTITTDIFLLDFNYELARTYTGVRHDSGAPISWGEKLIAHYEKLGINPKDKTLLFSDSLNFDKAQHLFNHFNGRTKVAFGIGTFVTNDTCVEPLNIVMKLQAINGRPVAKISDVEGKIMGNPGFVETLKSMCSIRLHN